MSSEHEAELRELRNKIFELGVREGREQMANDVKRWLHQTFSYAEQLMNNMDDEIDGLV